MRVFVVVLLLCLVSVQAKDFGSVLYSLPALQGADGGFLAPSGDRSIESTADALFLSSLYGLSGKINTAAIPGFIQSLENGDYGYGVSSGQPSDLESTLNALLGYKHLGQPIPNQANVATYVNSLVQSPLVRAAAGQSGSVKATAHAFQAWEILGEKEQGQALNAALQAFLKQHIRGDHFEFDDATITQTEGNYYGIVLARFTGLKIDTQKFAKYIVGLQQANGGFKDNEESDRISVAAASFAVSSLAELNKIARSSKSFTSLVHADALRAALANIPFTLRHAAHAHRALALVDFAGTLRVDIRYQVAQGAPPAKGKHVSQGSRLKPTVLFAAFGNAHTTLEVQAVYTLEKENTVRLHSFDGRYEPDQPIDLGRWLGPLQFTYTGRLDVPGLGEVSVTVEDEVRVGYSMTVQPSAAHEATGRTIEAGEVVSVGTEFDFAVTLRDQERATFVKGSFDVLFSVLDSSNVAIDSQVLDARKNKGAIHFEYSLQSSNIPSGELRFLFEIRDASGVVHTSESVSYLLNVPMVATNIAFKDQKGKVAYRLGSKATVTMEPASFPDLTTVHSFDAAQSSGRTFFLDAATPAGTVLRSIEGKLTSSSGAAAYKFEFDVSPTLDSIGNTVVSFRYRTASGQDIALATYDTELAELYDDSTTLNYTVNAELAVVDLKKTEGSEFVYGNEVSFRFRVKDLISGKFVRQSENANVFLNLNHQDERRERVFRSAQQPAAQDGDYYVISWQVEPNAVKGAGFLSLTIENTDGESFALKDSTGKNVVRYDVSVGGEIDVAHNALSVADQFASASAFVAEFELSCQSQKLHGARLSATVLYGGETVAQVPVANSQDGTYTVSWTSPHRRAPSGTYTISVFRDVDRVRATEEDAWKQREVRKERQERELKGEDVGEEVQITPTSLTPLFEIQLSHSAASRGALPIRTEFLAIGIFALVLYFALGVRQKFLNSK